MSWISWIFTALSVLGAYLNARGKIAGFYVWIPANIAWIVYDWIIGEPAQSVLFMVYLVICLIGIRTWRRKGIR